MFYDYEFIGAPGVLSGLSSAQTLTCPTGANGVLIQAVTQAIYVEFAPYPATSGSLQIPAGQPPVFIPLHAGGQLSVLQTQASATAPYRFARAIPLNR